MKKADIERGVVYAYQGRHGIEPVVIVSTDTLVEDTYKGIRFKGGVDKLYDRSSSARPTRLGISRASGYAAIYLDRDAVNEATIERAAAVTLEDFLDLVEHKFADGLRSTIVSHLPKVLGPYEEVMGEQAAERAAKYAAKKEREDRLAAEQAAIKDLSERAQALGAEREIWARYEPGSYRPIWNIEDLERVVVLAEAAHKVWEEMERASKEGALTPGREGELAYELAYELWNRVNEINAQPSE